MDTARIHRGAILDKARMHRGAILAVQGSLSRGAILGLDNIGWSDVISPAAGRQKNKMLVNTTRTKVNSFHDREWKTIEIPKNYVK